MKNDELIKKLNDLLTFHAYSTKNLTANGLNDQALLSEDLYLKICNKLFKLSLTNTNIIKHNHETIDLHDEENEISIQVTARNDRKKIKSTIEDFIKNKYYEKYKKLYFIIISNDKKSETYINEFETENKIDFSIKNNIFLTSDLISQSRLLDVKTLNRLVSDVEEYIKIPNIEKEKKTKESERMKLWEHISELKKCINNAIEIDPTATSNFDPEKNNIKAGLALKKLNDFYTNNNIYFDEHMIKLVNHLLSKALNTIDATRIFVVYREKLGVSNAIKQWAEAASKKKEFDNILKEIEGVYRDNT